MKLRLLIPAVAAVVLAAGAYAQPASPLPPIDDNTPIFGSQLMTPQERLEHRDRMRNARTLEERERVRAEHHEQMRKRAAERGVALPDEPPARGRMMGPGGMMGERMGSGMMGPRGTLPETGASPGGMAPPGSTGGMDSGGRR